MTPQNINSGKGKFHVVLKSVKTRNSSCFWSVQQFESGKHIKGQGRQRKDLRRNKVPKTNHHSVYQLASIHLQNMKQLEWLHLLIQNTNYFKLILRMPKVKDSSQFLFVSLVQKQGKDQAKG